MIKYAEKSYYLDFLISLNFGPSELGFVALLALLALLHSILYLGHLLRSQSMQEKKDWIN